MSSSIEKIAQELLTLKSDHKQFKKDHKELFDDHRQYNKAIKEKGLELVGALKTDNIDMYEFQGMEFQVKTTNREKHDMGRIADMVGDDEKVQEYLTDVQTSSSKVSTRKAKRKRDDDVVDNE